MGMTILKVLVGSRAHGLARPDSDYDYRGVYVVPTAEILSLDVGQQKPKHTTWQEKSESGGDDVTAWEIGHYLHLAVHCNPTILEVLAAPATDTTFWGRQLQHLFPYVWNAVGVRNAFIGYGLNQRKKFLEDKDARPMKYATAYLRTLYQAHVLLTTGVLPINLVDTEVFETLLNWRAGIYTKGEVIDTCLRWQGWVEDAAKQCKHESDPVRLNTFLLDLRRQTW